MTRPMLVVRIIMEDKIVTRMKTQIFKSSTLHAISALTLCLALTAISISPAAGGEDELILPLDGWRTKSGSQDISISSEHATRGEKSVRIDYVTAGWQMVRYVFADRGVEDWRGGDVFEFDLYIDHPEPLHTLRIRLSGQETGNIFSRGASEIPVQEWIRFSIPLRRGPGQEDPFQELARNSMGRLKLRLWGARPPDHPRKDITLYIDNMRVVSNAGKRLKKVEAKFHSMLESNLLTREEKEQVDALQNRIGRLKPAAFDDPEALERLSENLLAVEDDLTALSGKIVERSLGRQSLLRTANLMINLGQVEKVYDRAWRTLTEIERNQQESISTIRVRALRQAKNMAGEQIERLHQRTEIERLYQDSDFAVGIPPWPQAWKSMVYDGPIGREVRLQAARHEYEPFQLVILAHKQDLRKMRISASDLTGENGRISADNITVAPMGWRKLQGEKGWIADMLRPDIQEFMVASGNHQPVWVNLYVPPETQPGEYSGTITVAAEGLASQEIVISLEVWPFTLPVYSSLGTATHAPPADRNEDFARLIIANRWNPFQMYHWGNPRSLGIMREQTELGASLHNLLRISRNAASFGEDEDGNLIVTNKDFFFRRLDPVVNEIMEKDPGFMEYVVLYGFDEPPASQIPAMDDFYGDLKQRYHGIRTMFADLYGMWALQPELPRNLDIWAAVLGILNPEVRDLIQNAGMEVWWYNIYSNPEDPVGVRIQFWSTVKDQLDGLLHYMLDASGGGTRGRYNPWPKSLWPEEKRVDGGILRKSIEKKPISTVTFEYWREGMEDVEYIFLLRERRDRLAEKTGDKPAEKHRRLLRKADRLLRIPDTITTGLLGDRAVDVGEVVVETSGHTENMKEILAARTEIAELIVEIDEELDKL